MSISLPNGTLLAAPSSSQANVSAAVTRILHLSNFSAELKTRDMQSIFRDYENDKGGFRIKWVDDVNALVVFADATVAKRAYLSLLLNPPPTFLPPAALKPYDRPDASQIIASLAARTMGHRSSMSNAMSTSTIIAPPGAESHQRTASMSGNLNSGFTMPLKQHRASTSSISGLPASGGLNGISRGHQRNGSASNSWTRQGMGGGVLNFSMPSSAPRLPTHSESSHDPSRSSSASESEPIVIMDSAFPRTGSKMPAPTTGGRRESVSADAALRAVQKALMSVEAQG